MKLQELLSKYKEVENKTISVIKKNEFVEAVEPLLGKENTLKLYALKRGILISELADTIKEFPRLHKKQTIRLFENAACVRKEDSISGGRIMRPTLITIVECLEDYTGCKVLKENSNAPLRYLEEINATGKNKEITIEDIADYFSKRSDRKLGQLMSQTTGDKDKKQSQEEVLRYMESLCEKTPDKDAKICELIPASCSEEQYIVVLYKLEQQYNKVLPKDFDCNKKTVGELIDFFVKN